MYILYRVCDGLPICMPPRPGISWNVLPTAERFGRTLGLLISSVYKSLRIYFYLCIYIHRYMRFLFRSGSGLFVHPFFGCSPLPPFQAYIQDPVSRTLFSTCTTRLTFSPSPPSLSLAPLRTEELQISSVCSLQSVSERDVRT